MSGHFVIWDISDKEIDEIFETFQTWDWAGVAHGKGTLINPNGVDDESNKYQGWDEKNTAVFEKGVKWLGFPQTRDTVPPHNYIAVRVGNIKKEFLDGLDLDINFQKIEDRLTLSTDLEALFLKKQSSERFTWLDKLAIVPIEGQLSNLDASDMKYSNTQLAVEALKDVGKILDPQISAAIKHHQVKLAFFKQLAMGATVSLEIYSIDKLKIANPNDEGKGKRRKHWLNASK